MMYNTNVVLTAVTLREESNTEGGDQQNEDSRDTNDVVAQKTTPVNGMMLCLPVLYRLACDLTCILLLCCRWS